MRSSPVLVAEIAKLNQKLEETVLPPELKERAEEMVTRVERAAQQGSYSTEYEQVARYLDWVCSLPWTKRSDDILDLDHTQRVLDKNHSGLKEIKTRILEYLAVLKLRGEKSSGGQGEVRKLMRAPILCFVGLVGTGKTTIAISIAEAMGRKFYRIPFGGMGDALYLRGQSRAYPDAEPGQVIKALKRVGTKNPVILLDEIDRVAEDARTTIMGVLVELLDPEQNMAFTDHYLDFPFDLSEVLFIATCNNTTNISTAVLDRLEPMQMPSYTDEEKTIIARNYVLPKMLDEAGLIGVEVQIDGSVWPKIIRPLGYDAGIRTLERTINGICRKIARMVVEGKGNKYHLTEENIKEFLPTW
jgi:ATP-dependent Lon protease